MGLIRLSAKCRACPFVEKCDHKEMEALAYLEPVAASPCGRNGSADGCKA